MDSTGYDKLEKNIIDNLYNLINDSVNINKIKEKVILKINSLKKCDCVFNKKNIDKEILILKDNLDRIYLDKINNLIDDSQYKRLKDKILNRITFYENKLIKCTFICDYFHKFLRSHKLKRNHLWLGYCIISEFI